MVAGNPVPEAIGEHLEQLVIVLAGAAPLPGGLARDHFSQHSRTPGLVAGNSQFEIPVCVRRTGRRNSQLRPALILSIRELRL